MAGGRRHARRRPIGRLQRPTRRAHWKAAMGIEVGMDWAKQRLSWLPPWCPEGGIVPRPEQLPGWLGAPSLTLKGTRLRFDVAANSSPPPCGEGSGVGVGHFQCSTARPPTPSLPHKGGGSPRGYRSLTNRPLPLPLPRLGGGGGPGALPFCGPCRKTRSPPPCPPPQAGEGKSIYPPPLAGEGKVGAGSNVSRRVAGGSDG